MSNANVNNFDGNGWATSYALTPCDLYANFDRDRYIRPEALEYMTKTVGRHFDQYFGRILRYFFKLVIDDVIDNNVTFQLPPGCRARIEMQNVCGDDFIRAYQNGAFQDVDYLASNFVGNNLILKFATRYKKWEKPIHVDREAKSRITYNTNHHVQYG